jgi:chromosome condensin MukBEF ATPase and DNA-binding subunit MukB
MTELANYKRNRINNLQRLLNTSVSQLNSKLVNNINIIKISRLNAKAKQTTINNLINQYNNALNSLKQEFNNKVSLIQSYSPPSIIINRKKKHYL